MDPPTSTIWKRCYTSSYGRPAAGGLKAKVTYASCQGRVALLFVAEETNYLPWRARHWSRFWSLDSKKW
eukprot:4291007-Amphidinium_carterae.1